MNKQEYIIRTIVFFIGIMIMCLGISMIIKANLGVSAWDVLHIGLFYTFGLTIGTWAQIAGFLTIIITYLFDKKFISIGTILNMIFVGFFIDLFLYLLPTMKIWILQYLFLLAGIIIMGMGAGMYITSKLGPGPRDGLVLVLSKRFHWGVGRIKTMMEITVLVIGWFLGGPVFIGTLVSSLLIGPVMQFFITFWERKLEPLFIHGKHISLGNHKL